MTLEVWLEKHPYLQPVAELHRLVDAALATIDIPSAAIPEWAGYVDEFRAGVPLLQSSKTAITLHPVERARQLLTEVLTRTSPRGAGADRWREPGGQRLLGSKILGRYLGQVVPAFNSWRDEERWLRNYCPTCGTPPAMAQLVGKDPGRLRFLWCDSCGTRWQYRRIACPFCDNRDDHRLAVLDVQGEGGLRIDYCESCRGYLKTYNGTGSEAVLLADWTSPHLDLLARDRGLKRLAASLYDV